MVNSWLLYKLKNPTTAKPLLKFKEDLILEILQGYLQRNGPEMELENLSISRIILNLHKIGKRGKKNCVHCSTDILKSNMSLLLPRLRTKLMHSWLLL